MASPGLFQWTKTADGEVSIVVVGRERERARTKKQE